VEFKNRKIAAASGFMAKSRKGRRIGAWEFPAPGECRSLHMMRGAWMLLSATVFLCSAARAAEQATDHWLTNSGALPEKFSRATVRSNEFATLHGEVAAEALQVKCAAIDALSEPRLIVSADAPGHWPARDWRSITMRRAGPNWLAEIPVDSLDVPQIYFVAAKLREALVVSPMRIAQPRALGLERPTHFFWAFLEGFEQDLDSWRVSGAEPRTEATSRSGRSSLALRVPPGQRSVNVQTTRLRGWAIEENRADGVGLWLRTRGGNGVATFTLFANAFTTNQMIARRSETLQVTTNWSRARLTFQSFPKVSLGELDLFSIDFVAEPGTELLIDDLYLLGRWREDF
jgi:hypothetical protein